MYKNCITCSAIDILFSQIDNKTIANKDHITFRTQYTKEALGAEQIVVTCRECKKELYKRARVQSSNIFSVGVYRNLLMVEFLSISNSCEYVSSLYGHVGQAHHLKKLISAHSAGEYFADEIKAAVMTSDIAFFKFE